MSNDPYTVMKVKINFNSQFTHCRLAKIEKQVMHINKKSFTLRTFNEKDKKKS